MVAAATRSLKQVVISTSDAVYWGIAIPTAPLSTGKLHFPQRRGLVGNQISLVVEISISLENFQGKSRFLQRNGHVGNCDFHLDAV